MLLQATIIRYYFVKPQTSVASFGPPDLSIIFSNGMYLEGRSQASVGGSMCYCLYLNFGRRYFPIFHLWLLKSSLLMSTSASVFSVMSAITPRLSSSLTIQLQTFPNLYKLLSGYLMNTRCSGVPPANENALAITGASLETRS